MAFGKKIESVAALKKQMAAQAEAASAVWMKFIPKDTDLIVRFLDEPDEWVRFSDAWDDEARKSYPVADDYTPPEDHRISVRYLANALIVDDDKVVPLLLPKTVMDKLVKKYDRYGTVLDRDYILSKEGTGLKTEYEVESEPAEKRNIKKYLGDMHDLESVLEGAWRQYANETGVEFDADEDEDDELTGEEEEEEAPKPQTRRRRAAVEKDEEEEAPKTRRRRPAPVVDEDEELTGDEEEEPAPAKTSRRKKPEPEPEPEPEEDEPADEDDFYTREELEAMTKGQLDSIARDNDINPRSYKKDGLIEALLGDDSF